MGINWEEALRGVPSRLIAREKPKKASLLEEASLSGGKDVWREDATWDYTREFFLARHVAYPADEVYLVTKGLVEVGHSSAETSNFEQARFVDWVLPNDIFGEIELFTPVIGRSEPAVPLRMTAARAITSCEVRAFKFDDLRRRPEVLSLLSQRAVQRFGSLADRYDRVVQFARNNAKAAVAAVLCELADRVISSQGVEPEGRNVVWLEFDLPEAIIGRAAGITRQAVSSAIREFRQAGLLHRNSDQQLCVLARDRLRALAEPWRSSTMASIHLTMIDELVDRGQNFRARNLALQQLHAFPKDLLVRYRVVLACARAGARSEAWQFARRFGLLRAAEEVRAEFGQAEHEGNRFVADTGESALRDDLSPFARHRQRRHWEELHTDMVVIAARLHKDLAFAAKEPGDRDEHLRRARERYADATGPFAALNVAALSFLLGEPERGRDQARSIVSGLKSPGNGYWALITRAEAHLMLGETEEARGWARAAARAPDARPGKRASTRRQLDRLRPALPTADITTVTDEIPVPISTAYSGHMMRVASLSPTAQRAAQDAVLADIAPLLAGGSRYAFGALAAGSDIIVAEAILAGGGELHVVLPMRIDRFIELSVTPGDREGTTGWRKRFDDCLSRASSVTIVQSGEIRAWEQDSCFEAAFRIAAGLSLLSADMLCGEARVLAIYDGQPPGGAAGTAMAVRIARDAGLTTELLPCLWRHSKRAVAELPRQSSFRPVIFCWHALDATGWSRDIEAIDHPGPAFECHDIAPIEQKPEMALYGGRIIVCPDERAALGLLATLRRGPRDRIALDFGSVMDRDQTVNPRKLVKLRAGEGPFAVPDDCVVATETFAAVGRLVAGDLAKFEPMGLSEPTKRKVVASRSTGSDLGPMTAEVETDRSPAPSFPLYRTALARPGAT